MVKQILKSKNSKECYNKSDQGHHVVNMKRANSKRTLQEKGTKEPYQKMCYNDKRKCGGWGGMGEWTKIPVLTKLAAEIVIATKYFNTHVH